MYENHKPYDPQEEPKSVDGKTGSGNSTEFFSSLQTIDQNLLSDDEIMEILRFAVGREQARRKSNHPGQQG
jgi:hypothetical protein